MKLRLAFLSGVLTLAACVDNGNKLEELRFTSSSDVTVPLATPIQTYVCFPQLPTLIGRFTDGSLGDFTQRSGIKYSSSDPAVLEISNGDIPVPGTTTFYARGILIPHAATRSPATDVNAVDTPITITAEFAGLTATTQLVVHGTSVPQIETVSPSSTDAYMAPGSFLSLKATAVFDGRERDVTQSGAWALDVASTVASITNNGVNSGIITAPTIPATVTLPTAITASYSLASCSVVVSPLTVTLAELTGLQISREFPLQNLLVSLTPILSTTDAIRTVGTFAGGKTQDLDYQAIITATPTATVADGTQGVDVPAITYNLLRGKAEDTVATTANPSVPYPAVTVKSSFASQKTGAAFTFDATLGETVVAQIANLKSVVIEDDNGNTLDAATGLQINAYETHQLHAIGTFEDPDTSGTVTRDITRHVQWSVGDTTVAGIGNTYPSYSSPRGLVGSLKDEAGCVLITATTGLSDTATPPVIIQATAKLRVAPTVGAPPAAGCTVTTTP